MICISLFVFVALTTQALGSLVRKGHVLDDRQASPFDFCSDPVVIIAETFLKGLAPLKPPTVHLS